MNELSWSALPILSASEMAAVDRRTESEFATSLESLMTAAGEAVACFCLKHQPAFRTVAVLCGSGNNGGDGLVAARALAVSGKEVRVYLLSGEAGLRDLPRLMLQRLREATPQAEVISIAEQVSADLSAQITGADLVLDAVVGTGFKPPLRGVAAQIRDLLEHAQVPVVAVDLPSGWDADSTSQFGADGEEQGDAKRPFRADAVVTFTAPKLAHIFGHLTPGRTFGPVVVAPIGSPAEAVSSTQGLTWTGSAKSIAERPRDVNSNKGKFGHVLVVGGSYGKSGAPSMASLAALRTGAGLVTAAVAKSIVTPVAAITPELMTLPLAEDESGSVSLANLSKEALEALTKGIKVLAVGPGLSTEGDASAFARGLIEKTDLPAVIDADALNAFAGKADELKAATGAVSGSPRRFLVLTPHPGEMARLLGTSIKEVEADRVDVARRFATEHGVTLVLKGWRTLVAHPDGSIAVNTTGNPAMAKGGSGDILTGIVAAMLAQFPDDPGRAVEAAVYLHGSAGDFAAMDKDEHTVLATDTLAHLSNAFRYRVTDEDGFTWICGLRGQA